MSSPSSRIWPLSSGRAPAIMLNKVDLPAPLGPISPVMEPCSTCSEQSFMTLRPPKALCTCLTSIMDDMAVLYLVQVYCCNPRSTLSPESCDWLGILCDRTLDMTRGQTFRLRWGRHVIYPVGQCNPREFVTLLISFYHGQRCQHVAQKRDIHPVAVRYRPPPACR